MMNLKIKELRGQLFEEVSARPHKDLYVMRSKEAYYFQLPWRDRTTSNFCYAISNLYLPFKADDNKPIIIEGYTYRKIG